MNVEKSRKIKLIQKFCSRIFILLLPTPHCPPPSPTHSSPPSHHNPFFVFFISFFCFLFNINFMSNQMLEENQAGKSDSTESSTCKKKSFQLSHGLINYQNIEQRIEQDTPTDGLKIRNYLCERQGNKFIKITEISWKHQTLKIVDEYEMSQKYTSKDEFEHEVRTGQNKRFNYSQPNNSEKKDTKNLIKNLVNLFNKWLKLQKEGLYNQIAELVKETIDKNVYYNKVLISELAVHQEICSAFIEFCEGEAQSMIEHSRINDKKCHYKALKNYKKYFQQSLGKVNQEKSEYPSNKESYQ